MWIKVVSERHQGVVHLHLSELLIRSGICMQILHKQSIWDFLHQHLVLIREKEPVQHVMDTDTKK